MKEFKIIYKESSIGWFFVEAKDEKSALVEFEKKLNRGEIDFSDLTLEDSGYSVESEKPMSMPEMATISQRDAELEELWKELGDVPFDEDDEGKLILAEPWRGFAVGTDREDIWHWFDIRYSKGVVALLYVG